jgi:hypothetical protein
MLNDNQIQKLQKVQNRMMRLILRANWLTPIREMHDKLGWMTIKQRIYYNTLKLLYNIENDKMPNYLKKKLIKRKEVTNYNLRRRSNYCVPNFTKESCQNCLFYKGINIYNQLKNKYKISSFGDFKKYASLFVKEFS